jgi:hypothetical protein
MRDNAQVVFRTAGFSRHLTLSQPFWVARVPPTPRAHNPVLFEPIALNILHIEIVILS